MKRKPTILTDVTKISADAVIIRCIYERGQNQQDAFAELNRRGLWLSDEQMNQAHGVIK